MSFKRPLPISPVRQRIIKTCIESNKNNNTCQVCGDKAHIFNYGALSCASCKTFFRRHGFHPESIPQCDFHGNCEITLQSRRMCTACRFSKCLAVGMSPDFIRKEDLTGKSRSIVKLKPQYQQMATPKLSTFNGIIAPLNLLSNDISPLSPANWVLLSNVIHAYDSFSPISELRHTIEFLTKSSMSVEHKLEESRNMVSLMSQTFQLSVSATADFRIMTTDEQCSLLKRNMRGIWAFHSMVMCHQCNLFDSIPNKNIMVPLYGLENVERVRVMSLRLDPDETIVKLILMVLSFSSNCFTVSTDHMAYRDNLLMGTFRLFGSQNAYIEVMWKYMLYRYGYFESAKRFSALIKLMLDEMTLASNIYDDNEVHKDLSNKIINELERSLSIDGSESIPLWGKIEP
ncbi:unnamed protein product [Rotaria socialis]|uniref:Nuclear receptor domain-containing protein n=1 Tax=Rotaria socialis TaxID=392032 RepID=A0A820US89_9BILA|nr:unnamed protein product [Rotaria socialis]CAF3327063.1 unnamed protein product [Rotaria socialis]CAF3327795.1 unnamed protein product [Rotaria socialis]CAF3736418.1 unnamed protein product [Rotaria socialis]CAF4489495.1 unnamed protein product [Rotaria socialis]